MQEEYKFQKTLLYVSDEGEVSLDVIVDQEGETFWATQKTMAEVFGVKKNTINYHLKNIFADGELNQNSVVRKIEKFEQLLPMENLIIITSIILM